MSWKSNVPQIKAKMREARFGGLIAAATIVVNAVKRGLAGGYTSGNFVTGHVLNSVRHTEPAEDERGAFILVGTDVPYALFWELGHFNLFSRRFERVEVWMPALLSTRAEQLAAFQRVYARVFGGAV